jgi:hypothetical protein
MVDTRAHTYGEEPKIHAASSTTFPSHATCSQADGGHNHAQIRSTWSSVTSGDDSGYSNFSHVSIFQQKSASSNAAHQQRSAPPDNTHQPIGNNGSQEQMQFPLTPQYSPQTRRLTTPQLGYPAAASSSRLEPARRTSVPNNNKKADMVKLNAKPKSAGGKGLMGWLKGKAAYLALPKFDCWTWARFCVLMVLVAVLLVVRIWLFFSPRGPFETYLILQGLFTSVGTVSEWWRKILAASPTMSALPPTTALPTAVQSQVSSAASTPIMINCNGWFSCNNLPF